MSLTAAAWILAFIGLHLWGFVSTGVCFLRVPDDFLSASQLLVVGAGALSFTSRWSLFGALVLAAAVAVNWTRTARFSRTDRLFFWLLAGLRGELFRRPLSAGRFSPRSAQQLDLVWKACGLALLARLSIRDAGRSARGLGDHSAAVGLCWLCGGVYRRGSN